LVEQVEAEEVENREVDLGEGESTVLPNLSRPLSLISTRLILTSLTWTLPEQVSLLFFLFSFYYILSSFIFTPINLGKMIINVTHLFVCLFMCFVWTLQEQVSLLSFFFSFYYIPSSFIFTPINLGKIIINVTLICLLAY